MRDPFKSHLKLKKNQITNTTNLNFERLNSPMCDRAPVGERRGGPPEHSSVRAVGRDGRVGRVRGSRRAQVGRRLVGRDVVVDGLRDRRAGVHGRVGCDHVRLEETFWNVKDFGIMIFPYVFYKWLCYIYLHIISKYIYIMLIYIVSTKLRNEINQSRFVR